MIVNNNPEATFRERIPSSNNAPRTISMVQSKCTIALLVYVSGGIYRGNHNIDDYKNMFENIVNNLLTHVQINGLELGSYFDSVYLI